jgi:hypothetical protein
VLFTDRKRLLRRVPEGVDGAALTGAVGLLNDGQTLASDIAAGTAGPLSDFGINGHLFQAAVVEAGMTWPRRSLLSLSGRIGCTRSRLGGVEITSVAGL